MTQIRKAPLTPQQMYRIYMATRGKDARVEEILAEYGLSLEDLEEIEAAIEDEELAWPKGRRSARRSDPYGDDE